MFLLALGKIQGRSVSDARIGTMLKCALSHSLLEP